MVSGQRLVFQVLLLMTPTGVYPSALAVLPPLGALLRVVATNAMERCTMSATAAAIGQLLLAIATLTSCTSTALATSNHPTTTFERAGLGSVASKSLTDSLSKALF